MNITEACKSSFVKGIEICSPEFQAFKAVSQTIPASLKTCQENLVCTPEQTVTILEMSCPAILKLRNCLLPLINCPENNLTTMSPLVVRCMNLVQNGSSTINSTSTSTVTATTTTITSSRSTGTSTKDATSTETTTSSKKASTNTTTSDLATSTKGATSTTSDLATSTKGATTSTPDLLEILDNIFLGNMNDSDETSTGTITRFDTFPTGIPGDDEITISSAFSLEGSLLSFLAIALIF